jgi:hypothetical protein
VNNAEKISDLYRDLIRDLGFFEFKGKEQFLHWSINKPYSDKEIESFLSVLDKVIEMIEENGLKES